MNARTCCWVSVCSASLRSVSCGNGTCNRAFFARSWASEMASRRNSSELYTFPLIVNEDIVEKNNSSMANVHLFTYTQAYTETQTLRDNEYNSPVISGILGQVVRRSLSPSLKSWLSAIVNWKMDRLRIQ